MDAVNQNLTIYIYIERVIQAKMNVNFHVAFSKALSLICPMDHDTTYYQYVDREISLFNCQSQKATYICSQVATFPDILL